jgi:hypothetical protein
MSAYSGDQERDIRTERLVKDWAGSGLISEPQRDQLLPELRVDLRRTNKFLRGTLFVFGVLILQSFAGVLAIAAAGRDEVTAGVLCAIVAAGSFWIANYLITRQRLYRFGIEEAAAVASVILAGIAAALISTLATDRVNDGAITFALLVSAAVALALFRRFGFVYGGVAAIGLSVAAAFVPGDSDVAHRLVAAVLLIAYFAAARSARGRHGHDFPGDNYAVIEAMAWIGLYLVINLKISSWLSSPEDRTAFYWTTYTLTWLMPATGLWIAIRDRHRMLIDVNIVMAIITLMTNKAYLGIPRQPYDPVAFGVLLIAVALGVRRWLAAGADGSRGGYVAKRLLASEKERLGVLGTISVVHQGPVADNARPPEPAIGGGGESGGAGASAKY